MQRFSFFPFYVLSFLIAMSMSSLYAIDLAPNARIVFLGDSITEAGAQPGGYVALVQDVLSKSKDKGAIEVIGAGISGNRVPDLEARLQRDVLDKRPNLVVVYIGINDVWHSQQGKGTPKEDFEAGLRRVIGAIQKGGARVLLCTPSVIGERGQGENSLDKMLDEYSDVSRMVARETQSQLVDLRTAFLDHLTKANPENKEFGILTSDRVHLNDAGNRFLAKQMLAALGVSDAELGKGAMVRHVVLFKFRSVPQAEIDEVVTAFKALPSKISEIAAFECGTDMSTENRAKGFTHAFLVTFQNAAGRDTYLVHPAHEDFVKIAGPRIEDVLVFDFEVPNEK
jgi:lysophospholipase L1-like esterase